MSTRLAHAQQLLGPANGNGAGAQPDGSPKLQVIADLAHITVHECDNPCVSGRFFLSGAAIENLGLDALASRDPGMQECLRRLRLVTGTGEDFTLVGETGSSKSVLAAAAHRSSPLADKPFVSVNCGQLDGDLNQSKLFGHMRGAFTGAVADQDGYLQRAVGGTLFLDEIGNMPHPAQEQILTFLDSGMACRVGQTTASYYPVRIIFATNTNLDEAVDSGRLREDLRHRITTVLEVPPLRDRPVDLAVMIDEALAMFSPQYQTRMLSITDRARQALLDYPWPGNMRQFDDVMRNTVRWNTSGTIDIADIRFPVPKMKRQTVTAEPPCMSGDLSLPRHERWAIDQALAAAGGNVLEAAKLLQIGRATLYAKLKEQDSQ